MLGHEGAGIVREIGAGVTSVSVDDHVIPLYTPECRECDYCLHPKPICVRPFAPHRARLDAGRHIRFSHKGLQVHHYMGTSTFSNFTILPEIALARVTRPRLLIRFAISAAV